ncbi:MAG: AAA domain-containing protein [Olpidium bornovanus]|uniref:AAA domain-containing protein n=1 Tax=Olpidium bornovanus TaxID=278681 RepID=A0A8H7ZZ72_9FUNG|nr:MAG: AAA domain-containing protein [Olpidium bornovanus]
MDESLMERLGMADREPVPMARLKLQRRMRPEIADLVRTTLYAHLCDHEQTKRYPPVAGLRKNLWLLDHTEPEEGSDDPAAVQSHRNNYEAGMIAGLLEYLLRNGYRSGDIAILTPYLSQMLLIRSKLSERYTVVFDERDAKLIAETLGEEALGDEPNSRNGKVTGAQRLSLREQVTLRTVDNFQGEEAKIVLVSLVRNQLRGRGTIGFLKSSNRTNVLLSRAQHGMVLMGNAGLLREKSPMWRQIIELLESRGQIGGGLPIACKRHNQGAVVASPEDFKKLSPDGGCSKVRHAGQRVFSRLTSWPCTTLP